MTERNANEPTKKKTVNYCNRYYHLQFLYLYTDIKVGEKKFVDRVFKVNSFTL